MKFQKIYSCCFFLSVFFISFGQTSDHYDAKIDELVRKMTLEEKINMIHASSSFTSAGVSRLSIPELIMSDGPHGVRPEHGRDWNLDNNMADSGTYLPTGVCLAATWNPRLGYAFGSVLGSEANYRGKDVILGPGINIIRTPLNGRNFEYQSEDPFLVSRLVVGYIRGVQDQGISACVKHYIANNQEVKRNTINVEMSERALREIYLPGFKAAVQEAGVNTIMPSYNKFRGQWAAQNNYLLNQVLKKEWGFQGVTISDWGAVHSTMQAIWNGMDLEMGTDLSMLPNPDYRKFFFGDTLIALVRQKKIPEYLIDEKVKRILYVMLKTNMLDGKRKKGEYNKKEHHETAMKIAEEGIVLLKNQSKFLPLDKNTIKTIAVIGFNAERKQSMGGGSSQVRAFYEITALQGIKNIAGSNIAVNYAKGYNIARGAASDKNLIAEAVAIAAKADVVIYVGGWTHGYNYSVWSDNAYDAEDTDKPDMMMPFGQDELLKAVLKANPKIIVVLMGGGAIDMRQWIDDVPAILQLWYPGMEGGNALAKIIFGEINPSGKLPMTFPKKLEDHGSHALGQYPGDGSNVHYFDDIYVGYRYYDSYNIEPQFAFGHGLSYTSFSYSNLKLNGNNKKLVVSFDLKNTGIKAGAEVAQVYVSQSNASLPRPAKELKGFQKIFLQPGESKTVTINLDESSFQYFNDVLNKWVFEKDSFTIFVGSSSRDTRLNGKINL
jgi:beta-glucosidase